MKHTNTVTVPHSQTSDLQYMVTVTPSDIYSTIMGAEIAVYHFFSFFRKTFFFYQAHAGYVLMYAHYIELIVSQSHKNILPVTLIVRLFISDL